MDRKKDWSWFRQHMPQTAAMLAEYREGGEGAHIDECWQRGVLGGEPNWFYAREGPIALGTPFDQGAPGSVHGEMEQWVFARTGASLCLAPLPIGSGGSGALIKRAKIMRREGVSHGAH